MTFDLLLHGGTVLDGTGAGGLPASVGVRDGRIAAVGDLTGATAARTVDCTGRVVAPGFIDMHSHSDWVPTEAYLDLVGELGSQARIMNWNYSGRDAEEASLRKVLAHSACCFETDTILTGNGVDNPASYGTFPRLLGRYVRELRLFSLGEAIRRMTAFNAERMGLQDRGRIAPGLAADLVVFHADSIADHWDKAPTGIETVVLNGDVVVTGARFDRASRAGRVLRHR